MGTRDAVVELAPRLRAALVSAYGAEVGADAAAEALTWAFEHLDRVAHMENPAGYLYRVGQSAARRVRKPLALMPGLHSQELPDVEPALVPALEALSEHQRQVVLMVHAFGWPQVDVAEVLGVSPSTVAAHLRHGMDSLRASMEVSIDG